MTNVASISRLQQQVITQFYSEQDKYQYLLVSDKDSLNSFIAAHAMSRTLNYGKEFKALDIRVGTDLLLYVRNNNNCKIVIFDCLLTMQELLDISAYCYSLIVFTTRRTLFNEYNYTNASKKLPKNVSFISEFNCSVARLVYSCLHRGEAVPPTYITATDYEGVKYTIVTAEHQLLMDLPRDHKLWSDRYPDELKIAEDAHELGYRLTDNTPRLIRLLRQNVTPYHKRGKKIGYINCHKDDMAGLHALIKAKLGSQECVNCDYHVLYEIKDDWIYYEVVRHKHQINLTEEFKKIQTHGAPHAVIVRRPITVVFRGIEL